MALPTNRQWHLKRLPEGEPTEDVFELVETPIAELQANEFLIQNLWMSVDPYMRGRMHPVGWGYIAPYQVGETLDGACIGWVIESRNPQFPIGTYVLGMYGWREYWISDGSNVIKIDPTLAPVESFLGTLGMPGQTAYVGLLNVAQIRADETLFVSAAAGAVGSVACQIAKIKGCRVIGSAGSAAKIDWLKNELGVDEAINYREASDLTAALREKAPDGIHAYFDNVGGEHLAAALANLREFGRVAACGMISQYNASQPPPGPRNLFLIIPRRLKIEGFLILDHLRQRQQFVGDMLQWIRDGRIRWKETIYEGLENAPQAFIGLFRGENLGKMLVRIARD